METYSGKCHTRSVGETMATDKSGKDGAIENRNALRHRTLKAGKIVFDNQQCIIDCVIKNVSDTGARLEVNAWFECPDHVTLQIHDGPTHECQVVRHNETELGVKFLDE